MQHNTQTGTLRILLASARVLSEQGVKQVLQLILGVPRIPSISGTLHDYRHGHRV